MGSRSARGWPGLLMENSGQCCSIFKVLGGLQGATSVGSWVSLVGRRETPGVVVTQMVSEDVGMVEMAEAEHIGEDGGLAPDFDAYSWLEEADAED